MITGSVFENNRTQAIRLPVETRFPKDIKKVAIRIKGKDRILSPIDQTWDSFFCSEKQVTKDFMAERSSQEQPKRESF